MPYCCSTCWNTWRTLRCTISHHCIVCLLVCLALFCVRSVLASEIQVANATELNVALEKVQPGDTIVLVDGTWRDVTIHVHRGGTANAPMTLRARNGGAVVLTGHSKLMLEAPYITVDGLRFQEGALTKSDKQVVHFGSEHCRLTNTAIINYNPKDFQVKYYWVYFAGSNNIVDHCFFTGKDHMNPLIGNDNENSRHNLVEYCYIKDIPYHAANGREIFRIWGYGHAGDAGPDGAFFTIRNNLLLRAHGEGQEIISLKSNHNVVVGNTIRGTRGGICLRMGNDNRVEGNYVLGEGVEGSYGVRITGENHTVVNNYIERCGYGINIMAGEYVDSALTPQFDPKMRKDQGKKSESNSDKQATYYWPRNNEIAHNAIIQTVGPDFILGGGYRSHWPEEQRVLLPEKNRILDNRILREQGEVFDCAAQVKTPPLERFHFAGNTVDGNIVSGGRAVYEGWFGSAENPKAGLSVGFAVGDVKLERGSDGIYRAAGQPAASRPLTVTEVGPSWIVAKRRAGEKLYD